MTHDVDESMPNTLSRREREIAEAYAEGRDHKDIADRLFIAPATVRTHLASIYRKLGVSTKLELFHALNGSAAAPERDPQPSTRRRPSIAVLPFVERSGDASGDFLTFGIAEGITSELARFRGLFVISHASSVGYRGSDKDALAVAKELGARYLVTGSIARSGERVRVVTELLDCETGSVVWSLRFDRILADIFELQDELVRAITAAVVPEIESHEMEAVQRLDQDKLGAWELYCRAYLEFLTMTEDSFARARRLCDRAIELDRGFSRPHSLLSRCHFYELISGRARDWRHSVEAGLHHARRALEIDSRDDVAYSVLGYNLAVSQRWREAFAALTTGLEINPNSCSLYQARATTQLIAPQGDLAQARQDVSMAISLSPSDPMRWTFHAVVGLIELVDDGGDPAVAREALLKSSAMPHADWQAHVGLAMAALATGDRIAAGIFAETAKARYPDLSVAAIERAFAPLAKRSTRFAALIEGLRGPVLA